MPDLPRVPLSILDPAAVGSGSTPQRALAASRRLARRADEAGCTRFWVAEHHNTPSIATSAPAVIIAAVAAVTRRIRVGAGGVMLPNHAPLVIAEQFGTLDAYHPGRVDLGLGRGPGADPAAVRALERPERAADDFPGQVAELIGFLRGGFAAGHPYHSVTAVPGLGARLALWILGTSERGGLLAGRLGLPFAFAHHLRPDNTCAALDAYRGGFRPSELLDRPYALVTVQTICADDDERAAALAASSALAFVRTQTGHARPLPSPEQAAAHTWTRDEATVRERRISSQAVGSAQTVGRRLAELHARTMADELMIISMTHDPAEALCSLERVRELFGPGELPLGLGEPAAPTVYAR